MAHSIRKAVVLGAGVMGSSIAGLLAGAGIAVDLLDIVPKGADKPLPKNMLADNAKKNLPRVRGVYDKASLDLIYTGNFEDDLPRISRADWIIEVVLERMDVKLELYEKIQQYVPAHAIVSSNTSGLSIVKMAEQMPESLKQRFLGVHFFNPTRYMKLVEVIPSPSTSPAVVEDMTDFIRTRLGKGTVLAQDTPNFIANRIGCYSSIKTIELGEKYGLNYAEVDALSGMAIGRSSSATYRTTDIVGLDTTKLIFEELAKVVPAEEAKDFVVPADLVELVELGNLGDKAKKGFFQRVRTPEKKTLMWNPEKKEYEDFTLTPPEWLSALGKRPASADVVWAAKASGTSTGDFVWNIVKRAFVYSAERVGDITDDFRKIDLCMQWGYNWIVGPFSLIDAMGAKKAVDVYKEEGEVLPAWVEAEIDKQKGSLFSASKFTDLLPEMLLVDSPSNKLVEGTDKVSLIDIGDGVGLIAFHSKANSLSPEMCRTIGEMLEKADALFEAVVIGNNGKNFCAGASLDDILAMARAGESDRLRDAVKVFQDTTLAIKYFGKPLVAAPFGMTLGGGCEVCMHAGAVLAQAETYMGLVEVGVGLIPGGGGTKEMAIAVAESTRHGAPGDDFATLLRCWQSIALGKVSSSGLDALQLGFLTPVDRINMDALTQIKDAKELALSLRLGYRPAKEKTYAVKGTTGYAMLKLQVDTMLEGNWISQYDAYLGKQVAKVICGGDVPEGTLLTEEELLTLEREIFVHLAMQENTQARMEHMLKTGKRLAN